MIRFGHWQQDSKEDNQSRARFRCTLCDHVTSPTAKRVILCNCAGGWGNAVKKALGRVGVKRKGCGGCGKRQQALNQLGWSITGSVMSTGRYVRDTIRAAIRNP